MDSLGTVMAENSEFQRVVTRVYELAQQLYNNDVASNIFAIYARLSDAEQTIFLKGTVPLIVASERPPQGILDRIVEQEAEFDLEQFNKIELIRLKSWLVKTMIVVISVIFGLAMIYLFIRLIQGMNESGSMSFFKDIEKFMKVLLGL